MHWVLIALLWLLLGFSEIAVASDRECKPPPPWPEGESPHTFEQFLLEIDGYFASMFTGMNPPGKDIDPEIDIRSTILTDSTPQGFLRVFNINLQRALLEDVHDIEHISDPQEKRRRAFDAWYDHRIELSALSVFMRRLLFDQEHRNELYDAHGTARQELAAHLMYLEWFRHMLDDAKKAISEDEQLPSPHPLHTLDKQQLKDRVTWVSQILLDKEATKHQLFLKVATTEYAQVIKIFRMQEARHRIALKRLWFVIQQSTWFYHRWLFRMHTDAQVLRFRWANATWMTKVMLPTVVVIGTALAIFGDLAGLKAFLRKVLEVLSG
jgi:hypothetical protein